MTHFFVTCYNPEQYNVTRDSNKVWFFVTRSTSSVMSHIITNILHHSIWQVEKAFVCVHAPHWTAALVCGADQHLWLLPLTQHCTSQHRDQPPDTFLTPECRHLSKLDCTNDKTLVTDNCYKLRMCLYTHSMTEVFCLQMM